MDPANNVGFFQGIGAKIDQGWENTPDTVQKLLKAPFQSFYDLGRVAVRAAQAEPVGEGEKLMEPSGAELGKAIEGVKFKDFKPADEKIPVGKGVYQFGYTTTKAFVQKCHLRVNKDDSLPVKAAKVSVSGLVIGVGVLIGGSVETVTRALRATFGHDARRMYGKLGQKYHKSAEESGGAKSSKKKSYDIKSEPAKFALHHATRGLSACMPKESEVDQAKGVQNGLIGLRIAGAVVGGVIVAGAAGVMRTTRDAAVLAKHTGQEIYAQHDIPKLKISRQIEVADGEEEPQSELEREAQSHGVTKKEFKEALGKVNRMTPKQLLEVMKRADTDDDSKLIEQLARKRLDAAPDDVKAKLKQADADDFENSEIGLDDEET